MSSAANSLCLITKRAVDVFNVIGDPNKSSGVGVSVSIGSSRSKSESTRSSTTAVGSTVAAGNDVAIRATATDPANKADSNINVIGSTITAGNNARLIADGNITLQAANSTAEQRSSNRSSSASLGIGLTQNGLTVNASANAARGNADGSDVTRTNSQVTAGNLVALQSGGYTTLKGAVVSGKQVTASIGGNLAIESLQDTSVFNAKQQSAGVGISVPIGAGAISGSINASNAKVNGRYANVEQQSGIQAGNGGFQIQVAGNTDLKGGVIVSSAQAAANDKNRFTTGTLTTSDIANKNSYDASSIGVGISMSGPSGTGGTNNQGTSKVGAGLTGTSVGVGSASGNDSSTTRSGISNGVITLTDGAAQQARTGKDTDTTIASLNRNVVSGQDSTIGTPFKKTWNGQQLLQDVTAQTQITAAFGQAAAKTIGDVAEKKMIEALAKGDTEALKNWSEGGSYRVALHAAAGALAGGVQGAAGAAASAKALPTLGDLIDGIDAPQAVKQALAQVGAAILGGAVGGTAGLASAVNVEANNRQLHPSETKWIMDNAKQFAREQGIGESEAVRRLAQQAFREVQFGVAGQTDFSAQAFLKSNTQGMLLPGDPNIAGQTTGYMFRADTVQKANASMYAQQIVSDPNALAFYANNNLVQPTAQQMQQAATTDASKRNTAFNLTVGAVGAAVAITVPPALSWCLSNPVACNRVVIMGGEIAAGDALGPTTLGVVGTASAVKAVRSADAVNAAMKMRGWEPAWSPGTPVIETMLQPGTKVNMIVDAKTADAIKKGDQIIPGGWATFDSVNSTAVDMRQRAAITSQFKPTSGGPFYVVEMEITLPVKSNIGFVGKQTETTGSLLRGGGTQVQFDEAIKGVERNTFMKVISSPKPLN